MTHRHHAAKLSFALCTLVSFLLLPYNNVSATPESRAAANFLLFSPSIRSNGMGETGVALTDVLGGYYNPATPALIAKNHFFGTANYLGAMKTVPGLASDIDNTYNTFQIGWNSNHWAHFRSGTKPSNRFTYSIAFNYYKNKTNLGVQFRTDAQGNVIGSVASFGKSSNYVLSGGIHYLVDFGMGVAFKNITESLSSISNSEQPATASAKDYGIQARIPIFEIYERLKQKRLLISNRWRPQLDISLGMAWHNRGDEIVFIDANQSDPLPAYRKAGWAGSLGLTWENDRMAWEVFKFTGTIETYTPQVGGVEEPGTADDLKGFEMSFLEILDIRRGKYDDEDGRRHFTTTGLTLKSDGLFRLIQTRKQQNRWFGFVANHLSISWTKFSKKGGPVFEGTSHTEFKILF